MNKNFIIKDLEEISMNITTESEMKINNIKFITKETKIKFDDDIKTQTVIYKNLKNLVEPGVYNVDVFNKRNGKILSKRKLFSFTYEDINIITPSTYEWIQMGPPADSFILQAYNITTSKLPGEVVKLEYDVDFRTPDEITLENYKKECCVVTSNNCPIDPDTNRRMTKCLTWRRGDEYGNKCRFLMKDDEEYRNVTIDNFCSLYSEYEDCKCEQRFRYKLYLDRKKDNPAHDYCWYEKCSSNSYLVKSTTSDVDCTFNEQKLEYNISEIGGNVDIKGNKFSINNTPVINTDNKEAITANIKNTNIKDKVEIINTSVENKPTDKIFGFLPNINENLPYILVLCVVIFFIYFFKNK